VPGREMIISVPGADCLIFNNYEVNMFFTFDKKTKKLSFYEKTNLSEHNILERQDIGKWVEDYPDVLGEELLIITTEYDKFDKTKERLDLLALDKDGTLVVVELKRDDSGKNVELQAIKYAAYCSTFTLNDVVTEYQEYRSKKGEKIDEEKARKIITDFIAKDDFEAISDRPRIILVSKEFRLKVTASVFWLRKFGLNIRCVKLTPYLIDENKIGFESTIIIPLPEAESYIIKAERKDNKEITLTRTQEDDLEFYRDMVKKIGQVLPIIKYRLEFPLFISSGGFTAGLAAVLARNCTLKRATKISIRTQSKN
jgi:hypothetical protein